MSTVEIVSLILRMARAFGWERNVVTTSYLEVSRANVGMSNDRLAFVVNSDGTITVSIGHVGTNFVPIDPLGMIGLLS